MAARRIGRIHVLSAGQQYANLPSHSKWIEVYALDQQLVFCPI